MSCVNRAAEILADVRTGTPFTNMTYLFQHAGVKTPEWLGGNCSYLVRKVVENCAAEGIRAYPFRPTGTVAHDAVVIEGDDGEKWFADPTYLLNTPVSLRRLFERGEVLVEGGPKPDNLFAMLELQATGCNRFGVKRYLPDREPTGACDYDLATMDSGLQVLDARRNLSLAGVYRNTFLYEVLTARFAGKIFYALYDGAVSVTTPGVERTPVRAGRRKGTRLFDKICRTGGADPDLLMAYFCRAAEIQGGLIRKMGDFE